MAMSQLIAPPFTLPFLQPSLAFVPIYIWSRKNTHEQVAILGLVQLPAPYVRPFSIVPCRKKVSLTSFHDLHTASNSDDWDILADEWEHQVGGSRHRRVHSRSLCMVPTGCMASRGIIGRGQNYPQAAGRIVSYLTDSRADRSLMILAGSA